MRARLRRLGHLRLRPPRERLPDEAAQVPDLEPRDARAGLVGRDLRGREELLRDAGERAAEAHRRGDGRVDVVLPDLLARPAAGCRTTSGMS